MNASESLAPEGKKVPGRRVSRVFAYTGIAVAVVVVAGMTLKIGSMALTDVDSRLTLMEAREATSTAVAEQLKTLRGQVSSLENGLAVSRRQAESFKKQLAVLSGQGSETAALQQALTALEAKQQAQETQLSLLSRQLEQLKSSRPQPSAVKAPAGDVTASKVKKTTIKSPVTGHAAPFVLTGVERRGAGSWAAVAPRGYRNLSQIALIGEGEAVAGWTLVSAGNGKATFRVNGRMTDLKVE
jgi:hypothetical protein